MKKITDTHNLLPRIIAMLGLEGAKGWRTWRIDHAMQRLTVLYTLAEASGDRRPSPLHQALAILYPDAEAKPKIHPVSVDIAQGYCLTAWLTADSHIIIAMPISNATANVADIYGNILASSLREIHVEASRIICIRLGDKLRKWSIDDVPMTDSESASNLRNAVITSILTNDETDFDIEIELSALRTRSTANRRRLQQRMERLGVSELRGKKATVFLRHKAGGVRIDLKRLETDWPQAYASCVTRSEKVSYLSVKLNKPEPANGQQH